MKCFIHAHRFDFIEDLIQKDSTEDSNFLHVNVISNTEDKKTSFLLVKSNKIKIKQREKCFKIK